MSIFNLFRKEQAPSSQTTPTQAPETNNVERKQTVDEPIQQKASTQSIPDGTKRVHNLIILDESGSMSLIYRPALTGVNETLQTIRSAQEEHQNQQHFVTLVAFDSGHYNQIYAHVPAAYATDITNEQYRPGGCTPLYDAMGRGLTELRPNVAKEDIALVTVITDGYENASREFNGKAIKALVESLKSQGWVFTYIGANQDVEAVAASMSIDNHLAFEADDESTGEMFAKECRSRKKFFGKLSRNMPMCDLSVGYFDEEDDDKDNKF